ncbi:MAG: amino acid-binding protein [Bacteroidales bacterium]|nr:amino acid-binding protein [Bacteroidales bacterium]
MLIKQLSVFLENQTGRINQVTDILGRYNINMTAFSVAEGSEFGILRLIVPNPEVAKEVLKENGFMSTITDVICLITPNSPGALAKALNLLAEEGVFIQYMYAFSAGETANVVIKPNNLERCASILHEHRFDVLKQDGGYQI